MRGKIQWFGSEIFSPFRGSISEFSLVQHPYDIYVCDDCDIYDIIFKNIIYLSVASAKKLPKYNKYLKRIK
jgi:hypothetical protein